MTDAVVSRVRALDLAVRAWNWPFACERGADIRAHFENARITQPALWDGRVLMARNPVVEEDRFKAEFFETSFASLLAWRDWGFPDRDVVNCFAMGALQSADGLFVLGEMSAHTANAGRLYFAAGTPDLSDVRDGMVDFAASLEREVREETGLAAQDYVASDEWVCVRTGPMIAMMRPLRSLLPGTVLRTQIEAFIAAEAQPELAAVRLVRDRRDFTASMPAFVTAYIDHVATADRNSIGSSRL